MSASVTALNRKASGWLKSVRSRALDRRPPLLQLARWGLENLELSGPMARERETLEAFLSRLEQDAAHNPKGAVRALADGLDGDPPLEPSSLGPEIEDAALAILEHLFLKIAGQQILSAPRD